MTVNAQVPIAGPYEGNGTNDTWDFAFLLKNAAHVYLVVTDSDGLNATTITSNYSVTGLDDDDGGTITYPVTGDILTAGQLITIYRNVPYEQPNRIGQQSAFHPATHEDTMDLLEMQIQQLAAQIDSVGVITIADFVFKHVLSISINYPIDDAIKLATFPISVYCYLPEGAGGCHATCSSPGSTEVNMLILKNSTEVGTVHYDAGATVGVITIPANVNFVPDDIFRIDGADPSDIVAQDFGFYFTLLRS